ncbi:MAG: regulatory protein RecX [Wenzhouxiangella sp.]|nr:MAG: regulatory protein RecX [Wenzhouxiangella sp.]
MADGSAAVRPADVRDAALRLLARREHSHAELTRKLVQKGWPADLVDIEVDALAAAGLQSDQRYAESFARSRAGKAYGPVRIRAELGERGIDRSLIEHALRELETDWFTLAADWYERRYGPDPVTDFKEKSRRQQALARRGFDHAVIRELV